MSIRRALPTLVCAILLPAAAEAAAAQQKRLLWGDTHLHTSYSADAYLEGNFTADPETAFRYAQGLPVLHPASRTRVQIDAPLDFLVVSDHAEFLGGIRQVHLHGIDTTGMGVIDKVIAWGAKKLFDYALADGHGMDMFSSFSATPMPPPEAAAKLAEEDMWQLPGQQKIVASAWQQSTRIADAYNRPGEFSAIIGWEWTSTPGGANLHRVVFTDGDAQSAAAYVPFSRDESPYPEDLWQWLERTSRATGDRFIAIPHNSNISKGYMFPLQTLRREAFTRDDLALRRKWEPVVEATQTKGDSETFPSLSPQDEFADFERYTFYIQATPEPYTASAGDFIRPALRRGLAIGHETGINPYQFGLIGSTDFHDGLSSPAESAFQRGAATDAASPVAEPGEATERRATRWDMSASGRAAVWAQDNTREAIVDAFLRREVYATTGPRIVVRFDAGWFEPPARSRTGNDLGARGKAIHPMGADLPTPAPPGHSPGFAVSAMKDPGGANLDRIQIIKGWLDAEGRSHEQIFDVAWSPPRQPDPSGRLPAVGNTVDAATASYTNTIGAPTLQALWQDPDFDPAEPAFYYARVLEIPTPRHSLYDAIARGGEAGSPQPYSLQERAYTSPIWYQPGHAGSPAPALQSEPPAKP